MPYSLKSPKVCSIFTLVYSEALYSWIYVSAGEMGKVGPVVDKAIEPVSFTTFLKETKFC